jgi:hypothetical protein
LFGKESVVVVAVVVMDKMNGAVMCCAVLCWVDAWCYRVDIGQSILQL